MKKLCFLIAFLISVVSSAQPYYGKAQFYRDDAWPKDKILYNWRMVGAGYGSSGQYIENDFEEWCPPLTSCNPAWSTCDECATGISCLCVTTDKISREEVIVYSGNNSVKMERDIFSFFGGIGVVLPITGGKRYQYTHHDKGVDGTELIRSGVWDIDTNEFYDFTTMTWSGAVAFETYTANTTWTTRSAIVVADIDRPNTVFIFLQPPWGTATPIYIDLISISEIPSGGNIGNLVICDYTSPAFETGNLLMPRVGMGPVNNTGVSFDGVDDCLYCTDCINNISEYPSHGNFSVGARFIVPIDQLGSSYSPIWSKAYQDLTYESTTYGANFHVNTTGMEVNAYSNPANAPGYSKINVVGTYSWEDRSGNMYNYTNNVVANQPCVADPGTNCMPKDINTEDVIGAFAVDYDFGLSTIEEVVIWDKALSAIEASKYNNPYFPAGKISDGFYVTDCNQDASYARCSSEKCVNSAPYACHAEGTGTMAIFDSNTCLLTNNSFEYFNGTEEAPTDFFSYSITKTVGDGTAEVISYSADSFHQKRSTRMKITGTTARTAIDYMCMVSGVGDDMYVYAYMKILSGNPDFNINIIEYDDGACAGNAVKTTAIEPTTLQRDVWQRIGGGKTAVSWIGSSYIFELELKNSEADILVDFPQLFDNTTIFYPANVYFPPVYSLMAPTSYVLRDYSVHNPLADYDEVNERYAFTAGFCMSAWVYDWAVNDDMTHYMIFFGGVGIGNTIEVYELRAGGTNYVLFRIVDSVGNVTEKFRVATTTSWTPGNWKYFEACFNNNHVDFAHHYNANNSTWYNWDTAGFNSAVSLSTVGDLVLGSPGLPISSSLNGYISEVHVSPYSATYTNNGFNNGRPPSNNKPDGISTSTTVTYTP